MREQILRQFFEGKTSATELARDIAGSTKQRSATVKITSVEGMDEDFTVTSSMAVRLCDAVLTGDLPPQALETIGFGLEASDKFHWDGDEDDVLASVIADWSCPEVNYPLTIENVRRFRAWLMGAEVYPNKPEASNLSTADNIISMTEKRALRPVRKRLRPSRRKLHRE
jgi:hypothetical protein